MIRYALFVTLSVCVYDSIVAADDHAASSSVSAGPSPGHSMHGESFNEGPRQAAYLMQGMGNVHFPISSKNPLAQRFFDQGIAQLHGFWYFEAERSFRQAASIDADHPMPYWGMARANIENEDRSLGFIQQAVQRIERASDKERRLIEAWHERVKKPIVPEGNKDTDPEKATPEKSDEERKNERTAKLKKYLSDLDSIAVDYPDDVELKAMIVLQAWQCNGEDIPIQSFTAMNGLLSEIFSVNPMHPAHHFRIHLWDYKKEELALQSAALCGQSAPGIAHMWHMPGHTYSRLKRYSDAAWQQEASARVDHAHMIRDRVLPDQIHNYAHNNEWLVRSLILTGHPSRAASLAKNMIELPRHPKYNTLENRGSSFYGRERLIQALVQYERWVELLDATETHYLAEESDPHRNDERLAWRTIAAHYAGKLDAEKLEIAKNGVEGLQRILQNLEAEETKKLELIDRLKAEATPPQIATSEPAASPETSQPPPNSESTNLAETAAPPESTSTTETTRTAEAGDVDAAANCGACDLSKDATEGATPTPEPPPSPLELFGKPDDPALPKELEKDWKLPEGDEPKSWSEDRKTADRELHEIRYRKQRLSYWIAAVQAHKSASQGDFRAALMHSHRARPVVSEWTRWEWLAQAGEAAEAWKLAEGKLNDSRGEFLPLVRGAWLLCQLPDKSDQLQELIKGLKPIAAKAETGIMLLERLKTMLVEKGIVIDWESETVQPTDIGERPNLDSLGPFRWSPPDAPLWRAVSSRGESASSIRYEGKPFIAVLYLGSGCLHCVEQLTKLSPKTQEFKNLGIELVAISTENVAQLNQGIASFGKPIDIPLLSNVEQDTFRGFRAYDDFEGKPLHGTFLIDADGKILWQDIGYEPFMDIDFLLGESERLLGLGDASN